MLGSRLCFHSVEEEAEWLFMSENKTDPELFIYLWFSIPSWLLHKGLKEKGERQEVLVTAFQWLATTSRGGKKILLWIIFTPTSGNRTTASQDQLCRS